MQVGAFLHQRHDLAVRRRIVQLDDPAAQRHAGGQRHLAAGGKQRTVGFFKAIPVDGGSQPHPAVGVAQLAVVGRQIVVDRHLFFACTVHWGSPFLTSFCAALTLHQREEQRNDQPSGLIQHNADQRQRDNAAGQRHQHTHRGAGQHREGQRVGGVLLALGGPCGSDQAADQTAEAAQMQHTALTLGQPGHRRGNSLVLGTGQHLDRAGGQAVGSLQQPDITVEVVAVHNKVHPRAVHELQVRGDLGVALVRNAEHGVQLARHRHIHDAALVQRVVLLILLAGHLDAVVHHHGAVAQDHALLADPAHIALAGHSLTIRDLFQQALAGDHAGKELVQRRVRIGQHRGRIDNSGVNVLHLDGGYYINKDTSNFVWISSETRVDSKGIIFFEEKYEHESQMDYQIILDRMNEELKKYIPGPRDSTWMALDLKTPMTAAFYKYDGIHYALLIRGLWTAENDFMGGPFVLNVVLDEKNSRIIYMMGYVYAPDGKKRNMLRQVESIVNSMKIDFPEEEKK